MTEPIPALAYHSRPQIGRRPIFLVLAILAIVFGGLATYGSLTGAMTYWASLQARRAYGADIYWPYVQFIVSQLLSVPEHLAVLCAGIAFLARSRWVVAFLCVYAGLYVVIVIFTIVLNTLLLHDPAGEISFTTGLAKSVLGISRGLYEAAIFLLLCNGTVRRVIYLATGVREREPQPVTG
ncbi:MAG TPA: hypothetical protein VL282_00855 [Tepidisphaeraceae bacterium]|jgi:hypothetical protein|nr:hypothetical protein [Tepidisphaeraceae bacterium]